MLLVETTISDLVEYVNLWNIEFSLNMVFYGQYGKYTAWTVENVLFTGVEIAPGHVLCEFDNFDLQGANNIARRVTHRLNELLCESFPVDDTPSASRVYGIMDRQAARTLRIFPAFFADTPLNTETEVDFKARIGEKHPNIAEEELNSMWEDFRQLVGQQKTKREEQDRRRNMTAEDAATEWLAKATGSFPVDFQLSQPTNAENDLEVATVKEFWKLIHTYGDRYSTAFIYVFFVIASLLVAILLFGVLRSTGIMKLVFANTVQEAEFGGAFAGFLITLIFLVTNYNRTSQLKRIIIVGNVLLEDGRPVKAH